MIIIWRNKYGDVESSECTEIRMIMAIFDNFSFDVEMGQPRVECSEQDTEVAKTGETTEVNEVPNPAENSSHQVDLIEVEINLAYPDQKLKIRAQLLQQEREDLDLISFLR